MVPFMRRRIKVTSPFGKRIHPITGDPQHHNGVDLAAINEPLFSPEPGTVKKVYINHKLNGNAVKINHGDYITTYVHMSYVLVEPGDNISENKMIGATGSTGRSTGPHLHFGFYDNSQNKYIDPMPYIDKLWSISNYADNMAKGAFTLPPISPAMYAVGGLAIAALFAGIVYSMKG